MYVVKGGEYIKDPNGLYATKNGGNSSADRSNLSNWRYASDAERFAKEKTFRFQKGELQLFKMRLQSSVQQWNYVATVARDVTNPLPFYVPLNPGGSPNTKYVGVKLSTSDPKSSNRGFVATNSLLETEIDYRSAITLRQ
jgi:hypothetical protein